MAFGVHKSEFASDVAPSGVDTEKVRAEEFHEHDWEAHTFTSVFDVDHYSPLVLQNPEGKAKNVWYQHDPYFFLEALNVELEVPF